MENIDPIKVIHKSLKLFDILDFLQLVVYTLKNTWYINKINSEYIFFNNEDEEYKYDYISDVIEFFQGVIITKIDLVSDQTINLYSSMVKVLLVI